MATFDEIGANLVLICVYWGRQQDYAISFTLKSLTIFFFREWCLAFKQKKLHQNRLIRTKDMTENVKKGQHFLRQKDLKSSSATKMLNLELKKRLIFPVLAGGASAAPWLWAITFN